MDATTHLLQPTIKCPALETQESLIDRKISQVMKWRLNGLELVKPYTECVSCIIFSYNYMYTCGEDAGILIWDLQTWRPLPHELELGRDTVSVCSCPSGRFLFGLLGCGTIVMWDSSNDFDLKILAEKTRSSIIALTHNGNFLVLASNDSVLRLIEIRIRPGIRDKHRRKCEIRKYHTVRRRNNHVHG